jgi:uncharacterized integral membrane protein
MKIAFWVVVVLVAAVLALFVTSNGKTVTLGLWPLSFVLDLPLYLAILSALVIGFVGGALCVWIGGRHRRRELRLRGRRIAALENELAAARAERPETGEKTSAPLAAHG